MSPTLPWALALVLLFSISAQIVIAQSQSYNWSITDQSPLITYTPLNLGDNTTTWNSTYSNSSWSGRDDAGYSSIAGQGRSAHTSGYADASAKVGFVGTALYVWGETYKLSAVIYVDGMSRSLSTGDAGVVGVVEGLEDGWHEVEVRVRGLAEVSVWGFTFTSTVWADESATISNSTLDVPLAAAGNGLDLTGNWNLQFAAVQDALTLQETNYTTLSTSSDSSTSFTIHPPPNTTLLFIYGLIDTYSTPTYYVTLTPNQDGGTNDPPQKQTYNASADWTSGNQVLYQATLSPGTQYTLAITFGETESYVSSSFGVGSVVYVQVADSDDPSSGLSKGAIAGIVIGALTALALAAFVLIVRFTPYGRRHRHRLPPWSIFGNKTNQRRTSIISQQGEHDGISPFPIALPALQSHDSDSSVLKAPIPLPPTSGDTRSPAPLTIPTETSTLLHSQVSSIEPPSTDSERGVDSLRAIPPSDLIGTSGAGSAIGSGMGSNVSRREKEDSMAAILHHLSPGAGEAGVPTQSRLTDGSTAPATTTATTRSTASSETRLLGPSSPAGHHQLRDEDAGPVEEGTMSPILPPEYQPSWAQQRRDGM